jgi:hypothetical protein
MQMIKTIRDFFNYRKREKIQNSEEPFFNLELIEAADTGVKVEMDWNKSFIKELRSKGYPGINDEQVIEAYLYKVFERAHMKNVLDDKLMQSDDE